LGVLPKPSKIPKTVERANYDALAKAANEALAKENRVHVFDLGNVKIEPLSNLRIRRKEQEFVSMWSMKDSYGVQFESDNSGNPIVRIINDDKVTINGVESFRFLHHIAQTETSDLTYAERI